MRRCQLSLPSACKPSSGCSVLNTPLLQPSHSILRSPAAAVAPCPVPGAAIKDVRVLGCQSISLLGIHIAQPLCAHGGALPLSGIRGWDSFTAVQYGHGQDIWG